MRSRACVNSIVVQHIVCCYIVCWLCYFKVRLRQTRTQRASEFLIEMSMLQTLDTIVNYTQMFICFICFSDQLLYTTKISESERSDRLEHPKCRSGTSMAQRDSIAGGCGGGAASCLVRYNYTRNHKHAANTSMLLFPEPSVFARTYLYILCITYLQARTRDNQIGPKCAEASLGVCASY